MEIDAGVLFATAISLAFFYVIFKDKA